MLFHLFVFFSHMNWSIPSYSDGKLTIRMIDVHIVKRHSVNIPSMYVCSPPSFLFLLSPITLCFILLYFTTPMSQEIIMPLILTDKPDM